MNDDCVVFMNPVTAIEILEDNPEMSEVVVASRLIPESDAIVVRRDDFLKWLYEDAEKMEREAEDNDEEE